jgi:predicted transcriptional regulator of viral defense system
MAGRMSRSLSPLESKLVLHLEWEKHPIVTIEQAMKVLGVSYDHARQVLHRLARDKWLAPILPGKYELIPADRGEHAFADTNPLFIGSTLTSPYYFSFATAAFFHGLSTQASATVYIATSIGKPRLLIVRDKEYRLVVQPAHKFFGAVQVDAYGSQVMMTVPEKTLVDCLDKPSYAGGVPEIASMLWRGKGHLNWNRLYTHASRFKSQSLIQRLGYLADVLGLSLEMSVRDALLARIGKSTCYLGQPIQWKKGGEYNATWHIVDNIPRQVLLGDIEVY